MKHLYLIRHAKSSWDKPHLADIQRPLNKRGKKDAPFMGKKLKAKGVLPDIILSSPAKRALKTAKKISKELGASSKIINVRDEIYLQGSHALFNIIKELDEKYNTAFLVGHNPDITSLAYMITHHRVDNIPTCGIFYVTFDVLYWNDISESNSEFQFFDFPKNYIS